MISSSWYREGPGNLFLTHSLFCTNTPVMPSLSASLQPEWAADIFLSMIMAPYTKGSNSLHASLSYGEYGSCTPWWYRWESLFIILWTRFLVSLGLLPRNRMLLGWAVDRWFQPVGRVAGHILEHHQISVTGDWSHIDFLAVVCGAKERLWAFYFSLAVRHYQHSAHRHCPKVSRQRETGLVPRKLV